jgi:hypothetical protein
MSFGDYLKKGWEVVKLNAQAIQDLAQDEKAFGPAIGIVAISGVCWAIGTIQPFGIIYLPILRLIGFFIFTGIVYFVATTFLGGSGGFKALFSTVGCAALITWVAIIPPPPMSLMLGILAGIWLLVVSVVTVQKVYGLDLGKAIIAVAAPIVILIILALIFGLILAAVGLSIWAVMGQ